MGKDIYSRVKYPKGQRSVGQVRMGTDVRGIGVKRESTHVALEGYIVTRCQIFKQKLFQSFEVVRMRR